MEGYAVSLLVLLALATILDTYSSNGSTNMLCVESEKLALLRFKQGLKDPSDRLSSWSASKLECCNWTGVICDKLTGHVKELHLDNPYADWENQTEFDAFERSKLQGNINASLLDLKYLSYLDLSFNDFGGIPIPSFIGSLVSLTYLNLSQAGFEGVIPYQLGNLSNLRQLGVKGSYAPSKLYVDNLNWLSNLSSLVHLYIKGVNLSAPSDWLLMINKLPSLLELRLINCGLVLMPSPSIVNFTSLQILDISENYFGSLIPKWIFSLSNLISLNLIYNNFEGLIPNSFSNMTFLVRLDLQANKFEGTIPKTLGNLCSLEEIMLAGNKLGGEVSEAIENLSGCLSDNLRSLFLNGNNFSGHLNDGIMQFKNLRSLDLSRNHISGSIPESIGRLSFLEEMVLAGNQLNGSLPESVGLLSNLQTFDISHNKLDGSVTEVHFSNLKNLRELIASHNQINLKVSLAWVPLFRLSLIDLSYWNLDPQFPMWLRSQDLFKYVDLSCTGISDSIPTWFWNITSHIRYLNLSHNQIHGQLPSYLGFEYQYGMDLLIYLGSNKFDGFVPRISGNVTELDLSNNSLSGDISDLLCRPKVVPNGLRILHLGENRLTGEIPDCWMNWPLLQVIKLGNNNLTGKLPSSLGYLDGMRSLHLRNNSLFGEIPETLANCKQLLTLNLELNNFFGNIPAWLGGSLSNLMVLGLRSNNFSGKIPPEFCQLTSLQIVDLADNNLSGSIPRCVNNLTAMIVIPSLGYELSYSIMSGIFFEEALVVIKGREFQYDTILAFLTSLDFSNNKLSGEIPEEITALVELRGLNLAGNYLRGEIPKNMGNMQTLESVDLSGNLISGDIPPSLSSLHFLNYLNLSYNNLTGQIPLSTQLQSLDASSFIGNSLCGPPMRENCSTNGESTRPVSKNESGNEESESDMEGFYVSMGVGFAVGLWVIIGPLLYSQRWRYSYYAFLNRMWNSLYVKFAIARHGNI